MFWNIGWKWGIDGRIGDMSVGKEGFASDGEALLLYIAGKYII